MPTFPDTAALAGHTFADLLGTNTLAMSHWMGDVGFVLNDLSDTTQLATLDDLDTLFAGLVGGTVSPWQRDRAYLTGDQVLYRGRKWQANQNLPAGIAPIGLGDGSLSDQLLALGNRAGFANQVTGGYNGTVVTVTNANDTGTGSLRQAIIDHQTRNTADPTAATWIIFSKTFHLVGGVPTYKITLGSRLMIAGKGAQNLTIDARGVDLTIDGGGAPGTIGVGVVGNSFNIGGNSYTDLTANGNTQPAQNIIVMNVKFISNFGGESSDTGSHDVVDVNYWARQIWFWHCEFTNPDTPTTDPDSGTDGLFDCASGSTEITVSWCYIHDHHKAMLINETFLDSPTHNIPPNITLLAPGPYELITDVDNGQVRVAMKITHHHNYKKNLGIRTPYCQDDGCRFHSYNEYFDGWGAYKDLSNVVYWPINFDGGQYANSGSAIQVSRHAQAQVDGDAFHSFPIVNSESTPQHRSLWDKDSGGFGDLRVGAANFYSNGASQTDYDNDVAAGNVVPAAVFTPPYTFDIDPPSNLAAMLTLGAGANPNTWTDLGPVAIPTTIDTKSGGNDFGATSSLNFTGTGHTTTYNPTTKTLTHNVDAGTADVTTFLLLAANAAALPDPTLHHQAYVFQQDIGQLYQSQFSAGPNTYLWTAIAPAVSPVVPGVVLAEVFYHPTSAQTNATISSSTAADVATAATSASWSGNSASFLDATFTVPASQKVDVYMTMSTSNASSATCNFALSNTTATLTNTSVRVTNSASIVRCAYVSRLSSAILGAAGGTFTIRPQWFSSATSTLYAGGVNGPFTVRVEAA